MRDAMITQPQRARIPDSQRASVRSWFLFVAMAAAIPLVLLLVVLTAVRADEAIRSVSRQAQDLTVVTSVDLRAFLDDTRESLSSVATRPLVAELDPDRCDPFLADLPARKEIYPALYVVDLDMRAVCTEPVPNEGLAVADRAITTGQFSLAGYQVEASGQSTYAAVPIIGPDRSARGAAVYSISLAGLSLTADMATQPTGTVLAVMDADGRVLLRSKDPDLYVGRVSTLVIDAIRAAATTSGVVQAESLDGIGRTIGFTAVSDLGWWVVAGVPDERVGEVVAGVVATNLLVALGAVLTAALLAWYVAARLARPIRMLEQATLAVLAGESGVRAVVAGPREIAAVAERFNEITSAREQQDERMERSGAITAAVAWLALEMLDATDIEAEVAVHLDRLRRAFAVDAAALLVTGDRLPAGGYEYRRHVDPSTSSVFASLTTSILDSDAAAQEFLSRFDGGVHFAGPIVAPDQHSVPSASPSILAFAASAEDSPRGVWGLLEFVSVQPDRVWTPFEIEMGSTAAAAVTSALHRERAVRSAQRTGAQMRAIVEALPATTWRDIVGVDGVRRSEFISPQVERILGISADEIIADPDRWAAMVHPDDVHIFDDAGRRQAAGEPTTAEYRFVRPDGTTVWMHEESVSHTEPDGSRTITLVGLDVTAERRAAEALAESEARYRRLVEASPEPVLVLEQRRVVFANRAATVFFRGTLEDLATDLVEERLIPEDRARLSVRLSALEDGTVTENTTAAFTAVRLDGTTVEIESTSTAFVLDGRPAVLIVIRDATERNRLTAQLVQAQKMEAVGRLAGGVAHDFNNLLGAIRGYADLLAKRIDVGMPERRFVDGIQAGVDRSAEVVTHLLSFSRQRPSDIGVVDINATLTGFVSVIDQVLDPRISLSLSTTSEPLAVECDGSQLEQVILNLAINARDAMGAEGDIRIETAQVILDEAGALAIGVPAGRWVRLSVVDSGSGIPADVLPNIFDPFYTTKTDDMGTGLGLPIVWAFASNAGGTVTVETVECVGTRFDLWLPESQGGADQPVGPADDHIETLAGTERILVVDDEPSVLLVVSEILAESGYRVLRAADGAMAMDILSRETVDMMVTDLAMPRMTGDVLARHVRDLLPNLPILFISGYAGGDISVPTDPASAFLAKPVSDLRLLAGVRKLLDADRSQPSDVTDLLVSVKPVG